MKTIQPISIWFNGKIESATIFNLLCSQDNLINSATFYFQLKSSDLTTLSDGFLIMNLPDYATDWSTNNAAYLWAATQLGLTISGEYNPA